MIDRQNYKDVKQFLDYHKRALQNTDKTVSHYEKHFKYILTWCDDVIFPEFQKCKITLPEFLKKEISNKNISEKTASTICTTFRNFLEYQISENRARYGKIKKGQISEIRIIVHSDSATVPDYYTLDEMEKIVKYKTRSLDEKRTKASACFLFLSGMRIGAFVSIPIDCIDLHKKAVYQFPERGVVTKFSKRAETTLLNIPFLYDVVKDWDDLVRKECPLNSTWFARFDDSVFGVPKIKGALPAIKFNPYVPIANNHDEAFKKSIYRAQIFREALKRLCSYANIEYKSPHAFRHGHIHYALSHADSMEQFKAISQNVMHKSTSITDEIYSRMEHGKIRDVIGGLGRQEQKGNNVLSANEILSSMTAEDKIQILKELFGL